MPIAKAVFMFLTGCPVLPVDNIEISLFRTRAQGFAQLELLRSMVMFIQTAEGMQMCMLPRNAAKFTLFNGVYSFSGLCLEYTLKGVSHNLIG